jgi:hypothetical protein
VRVAQDDVIRLEWGPVTSASTYRVTIADTAASARPRVDRGGVAGTALEVRGLPEAKLYWRVAAIAADGTPGEFSAARSFSLKRPRPDAMLPVPTTEPTPTPVATQPTPPTAMPAMGTLQLWVLPWAEVSIDGRAVGTTPFKPLTLPPGTYTVMLSHPDYRPLKKTVKVAPSETTRLEVDLSFEAFPK